MRFFALFIVYLGRVDLGGRGVRRSSCNVCVLICHTLYKVCHNVYILIRHTLRNRGVGLPHTATTVLLFDAANVLLTLICETRGCLPAVLVSPRALLCVVPCCALLCRVAPFAKGGCAFHGRDLQTRTHRNLRPRRHAVLVRHRDITAGRLDCFTASPLH